MVQKDRIDCFGRTTHKMLTNRCGFFLVAYSAMGLVFFVLFCMLHVVYSLILERSVCHNSISFKHRGRFQ